MAELSEFLREASHAGSWYEANSQKLNQQLTEWLDQTQEQIQNIKQIKALIGPHAGYTYCGKTSAWAYKYLKPKNNLTVFLLGPSHRAYIQGCGISSLSTYETPLGNIEIDTKIIEQLKKEGKFIETDKEIEEQEHSLEMHLPYIQKMLGSAKFKLVPLIVGQIDINSAEYYGKIFSKYFDDENTLFVISSDFCHWGERFSYQYYDEKDGAIYQSIEVLDKQGMKLIESQNAQNFVNYIKQTKNTICGRNPITILLKMIEMSKLNQQLKTQFVHYDQSSKVQDFEDSSVSYAAGITYI